MLSLRKLALANGVSRRKRVMQRNAWQIGRPRSRR
jgi:hypothetical protein